ncbi:MAG: hypothetical protein AVDCRST_MAG93-2810 [uncultured Chloroflexia bacterium]|uniref:Uncharacterized protein n=1 Tax=uncultured Chloroflexia bacterium TaxID=1672391 RepID=A0A6J4JDF3_9CHLR|nr:MAG: hypothetical protein AVDCRST_MAG93-2810 [uncultured Chloroflexia bacterium]
MNSAKQVEGLKQRLLELSDRVVAAPGEQEVFQTFPQRLDKVEMRGIGRQVA